MDKQTKREMKKKRKQIYIFLLLAFPILAFLSFLLYYFVPSLVDHQWIVMLLIITFGGLMWFIIQILLNKKEENDAKKPKKHDPFAD